MSVLERAKQLGNQLSSKVGKAGLLIKSDNDVVICAAVRTPLTKAKKGGLKDACPEDLLAAVFKEVIKRTGVDPKYIEDVSVGNVLPPVSLLLSAPFRVASLLYCPYQFFTSH